MNDGSVCSNSSSSSEAEIAASAPAPATYAEAAAASPTQPPTLAIASPIHSPTHSNTCTPPVFSCQAQTILVDNVTTKHTCAEIEIKLPRQFLGVRYANKDAPTMELAKIKEGISRIDPVVGMENWEIRIEGSHRKFKGSYPTQLVLFKVQNDLIAKNISDQNFTIDGKQFIIREYMESTSFRCTRFQELGSHLSKDCSKKMHEMCWTRLGNKKLQKGYTFMFKLWGWAQCSPQVLSSTQG